MLYATKKANFNRVNEIANEKVKEHRDKMWPLKNNSVAHGEAWLKLSMCWRIKVDSKPQTQTPPSFSTYLII